MQLQLCLEKMVNHYFHINMNKAIFLDRDGVINKEKKDYVKKLEEFEIFDNIFSAIKILKEKGFLIIIITNQSAINRKLMKVDELEKIHECLINEVKRQGTSIDSIFYCPHRPDENCTCRKPKPGLILQASKYHKVDLKNSFFIGDSNTDMKAAEAAGCKGILLKKDQKLIDTVNQIF